MLAIFNPLTIKIPKQLRDTAIYTLRLSPQAGLLAVVET